MNRIIIFIVMLALLSWGVWAVRKPEVAPNGPGVTQGTTLKNYEDPEGVFRFAYPAAYMVTGREGARLAKLTVDRGYMPQTNFSEAWLTVEWSNKAEDIKTCHAVTNDAMPRGPIITKTEVSGHPFTKMISGEAAMGNHYETTTYQGLLDGDCYTIEYVIHSTNIQNYPVEMGIKEFDKEKVVSELENIVQSFEFLVNSD